MAKRKRPALFELIQKDKQSAGPSGALPPPDWWFKNRAQPVPSRHAMTVTPAPPAIPVVAKRVVPSDVPPPLIKREPPARPIPPPMPSEPTALAPLPSAAQKDNWFDTILAILAPVKSILTPVSLAIIGMAVIVVASGIFIEQRRHHSAAEDALQAHRIRMS